MTTRVHCLFVTPTGEPIRNARVELQPAKAGFTPELEGILMPRAAEGMTDATGQCTVDLWPSPEPYFIRCADPLSEAEVFYRVIVPKTNVGVTLRLQDLVDATTAAFPPGGGLRFETISNTQVRVKLVGTDGITRQAVLNLA